MKIKFTNNASTKLKTAIVASSTSLVVTSGTGDLFPALGTDEYFYVTLVGEDKMEIVKVTARDADTFTIVRAQDNTTAQAFSAGDTVELRITAAAFNGIAEELTDVADTCVRVTGEQTIAGSKIFTDRPYVVRSNPYICLQNTATDSTVTPASNHHSGMDIYDGTGFESTDIMGSFRVYNHKNGYISAGIYAFNPAADSTSTTSLQVRYAKDGTISTYSPSPVASADDAQIATTSWVRDRHVISTAAPSGGTAGDIWIQYVA